MDNSTFENNLPTQSKVFAISETFIKWYETQQELVIWRSKQIVQIDRSSILRENTEHVQRADLFPNDYTSERTARRKADQPQNLYDTT